MEPFDRITGNRDRVSLFRSLIDAGKCSHAYLLEAPRGGGKKTFALSFAAALALRDGGEDVEAKCRRIYEGASPDVRMLSVEEGKKTIGVDAVRSFLSTVYLTPSELSFKMFIFDEADAITVQAQNALLKVIEEPPHDVYLILLCENCLSMLSTVRSRVQKITLETFSEDALRAYAVENGLAKDGADEKLSFAVRSAKGAIGRLRALLRDGDETFAAYRMAKSVVEAQAAHASYASFLRLFAEFLQTREQLDALTDALLAAYRDLARARYLDGDRPEFFDPDEALRYSMQFATQTVATSAEAVNRVRNDAMFYPTTALAGMKLAVALWHA